MSFLLPFLSIGARLLPALLPAAVKGISKAASILRPGMFGNFTKNLFNTVSEAVQNPVTIKNIGSTVGEIIDTGRDIKEIFQEIKKSDNMLNSEKEVQITNKISSMLNKVVNTPDTVDSKAFKTMQVLEHIKSKKEPGYKRFNQLVVGKAPRKKKASKFINRALELTDLMA